MIGSEANKKTSQTGSNSNNIDNGLPALQALLSDKDRKIESLLLEIEEYKSSVDDLNDIIDGLKHTREKLIQYEKLSALGRFTADVAHEIRNPLTAIGGFARRLQKKLDEGSREKEYSDVIVYEVQRLEKILKNVLTFSSDIKFSIKEQNINTILESALVFFSAICGESSIKVEKTLGDLPPVKIDSDQVRQVFDNLLSNAIDSMPDGGMLSVRSFTEFLHNITYIVVNVTDNGEGISEEKLDKIFEPFCTTKEIGHGTGLGLSISRKIMEEHCGFIKVRSRAGEGSSFDLYFPYQSDEEAGKIQCWEFSKCNRDCSTDTSCPAYPNYGRLCWVVAGTYCEGKVQGTYAQKIENCKRCSFFKKVTAKEI